MSLVLTKLFLMFIYMLINGKYMKEKSKSQLFRLSNMCAANKNAIIDEIKIHCLKRLQATLP